jgi:hypothetical protein
MNPDPVGPEAKYGYRVPELWEKEAPREKILKDEAEEDILHVEGEHRLEQAEAHRAHLQARYSELYLSVCSVSGSGLGTS